MTALQHKVREYGVRRVAYEIPTAAINVRHFINRRYKKIGRATRKLIRKNFIERGWLPAPKLQPKCVCAICGKEHTQSKHPHAPAQLQTDQKISAKGSQ